MRNWQAESQTTWSDRLSDWVASQTSGNEYLEANVQTIKYWLKEHGVRVVVNAGAYALERLLDGDRYKNRYELDRVGGSDGPSPRRVQVDQLLGFSPDGRDWYFGAVAVGGSGVRFYGEYCLVLSRSVTEQSVSFLDRNSYELLDPPLSKYASSEVVTALRASWEDLPQAIALKVLSAAPPGERLVTVGTVADMTLRDEDFIEVHIHRPGPQDSRSFDIKAVEEIRLAPEDVAQHQHLLEQLRRGRLPTTAELTWCDRRARIERLLDGERILSRVVTTSGRGARWR